jgi:hypothetical protein
MCVNYLLYLIVLPLPPGKNPFAVKINNNNNNNNVGFVVDNVALGQVFSEYNCFRCQLSFHQLLDNPTPYIISLMILLKIIIIRADRFLRILLSRLFSTAPLH